MSTPLTNYLTTSNPTVQQFLKHVQLTPNGLVYQNILINTNQIQPVTYIGATNRERTRQTQLQELESSIIKTKQEKETLEIDLKNNENTQNEINTLKIKIAEQTTKCQQYKNQYNEHCKERDNLVSQQEQLENTQEPLLQSLNGYTQDQCSTLVQDYKDYQQLQKDLRRLAQDIERDKTRQKNQQTKHQNLATRLEDIKTKRIREQEELEDLQTDDRYQENINMIDRLTSRKNELEERKEDLRDDISNISAMIKVKNDTYCQKEKKQQELKDAHEETKAIIDAITIDNYTISDELNTIDTRDVYLNFKTTPLDVPKIPKSSFSERLNREIRELKNIQLDDQSLVNLMDNLQKEIDASSQVATTLLENAHIRLRLILFESLQKTNADVLKNVKAFVDTMNQQNPSHLQLSANYTLTPYGEELLEIINDSNQHNRFFTDLQDHLHKYLQDPDTTPEDIIDYLLDELEPRRWYQLNLYYERDNNGEINLLTTDEVNSFSTGERVRCYYLPIFALLEIIQNQMNPDVPRVLLMDEAFSSIDNEQTALILEKIYDLCDVFIATTPNKILPIVSNSKGLTTVWLERTTVDGVTTVQAKKDFMYEEIL
jgi:DNA repair exonuclease SbcCD ATPase subunit